MKTLWSQRPRILDMVTKTTNSYSLPIDDIAKKMEYNTHIALKLQVRSDLLGGLYFSLYEIIREPMKDNL